MKPLFSITLVHYWTREEKTFPVEVVTNTYVTIRWGLSGLYNLHLRKNELRAQNPKAHRRHGLPLWRAKDIAEVRRLVALHNASIDKRIEFRIERHTRTMPYARSANDVSPPPSWRGGPTPHGTPAPALAGFNPRIERATVADTHGFAVRQERSLTGRTCDPQGPCSDISCDNCWRSNPRIGTPDESA